MASELDRLKQQTAMLQEHVRRLLRAEQSLFLSQRAFERQLKRLDVLNRFAADAARLTDTASVLERAASAFCEIFPADQTAGFSVHKGSASLAFAQGAAGYEPRKAHLGLVVAQEVELPASPSIVVEHEVATQFRGGAALLDASAAVFGGPAAGKGFRVVFLPIGAPDGRARALLVFRMLREEVSFHEERPSAADLPFFELLCRQVSAALDNAALVASLSESYQKLSRAQEELVKRERLSALGELSAVVAHEVRNPLAAMVNAISTMKRHPNPDDAAMLLSVLSEEASRLDQIVNDMLDFARPDTPNLRTERIAELVRDAAQAAFRTADHSRRELRLSVDDDALLGTVDARMVRHAVVNLVLNAVQASAPGGCVEVSLGRERRGEQELARIAVVDQGVGISKQDLDRVFQPFFTTRATGTGLGLALVKRIVEAHRGEVRVASEVGKGSTFTVLLPLGSAIA